jgi:TonB family protein
MSRRTYIAGRDLRTPILGAAVLVSLAAHVAVVELAPTHEPKKAAARRALPMKPVVVEPLREAARIEAEQKQVEDAVRRDAPKPARRPDVVRPPVAKPLEASPPKPADAPKPEEAAKPAPAPAPKPAPFVLSNVALNGGVQVQAGDDSNLFGDPSVDAKGWKRTRDAPRDPGADGGGGEEAAPRRVVVKPPEPLNTVKGKYPPEHRDLNRVVRVELMLSIDASGDVAKADVVKGDLPAFDDAARRTVVQIRFKPATRDGDPIPYRLRWTVVFIPEGGG